MMIILLTYTVFSLWQTMLSFNLPTALRRRGGKWGSEAKRGAASEVIELASGRVGIWTRKIWLQNLKSSLPYSDSTRKSSALSPRQRLLIRNPREEVRALGRLQELPKLRMMEEAQTKWPEWPALLEWPLTKREWGQDDHLGVLLCANAPLTLSVHDSGEKKGIWHMWTFLSITQYKVLQQVTNGDWGQRSHRSLLSRKLHSKVKAYWKLFLILTSLRLSSYFLSISFSRNF